MSERHCTNTGDALDERRPWRCQSSCVPSRVRFGDRKNVQTHGRLLFSTPEKKILANISKEKCPMSSMINAFLTSTSWLFLCCFQPPGTGVLGHSFQAKKTTMETCQVWILKSLSTKSQQVGSKTIHVLNELLDSSMINVWKTVEPMNVSTSIQWMGMHTLSAPTESSNQRMKINESCATSA